MKKFIIYLDCLWTNSASKSLTSSYLEFRSANPSYASLLSPSGGLTSEHSSCCCRFGNICCASLYRSMPHCHGFKMATSTVCFMRDSGFSLIHFASRCHINMTAFMDGFLTTRRWRFWGKAEACNSSRWWCYCCCLRPEISISIQLPDAMKQQILNSYDPNSRGIRPAVPTTRAERTRETSIVSR